MILKLFYQLTIPLRETSLVFKALFSAIARECDILLECAYLLTKQSFPRYGEQIEPFAKERGVVRIKGESLADFTKRVERSFAFLTTATTREGIIQLIKTFTDKDFTLKELWEDDWILGDDDEVLGTSTTIGGEDAANTFVVVFDSLTLDEKNYISELIELYKPAHVRCVLRAQIQDDWVLGAEGEDLGISTYLH
ncbi:MAG: hypothetical protein ACRCY4_04255 [Brevinema sp.]